MAKKTDWPLEDDWPTGTQGGRNLGLSWAEVARWIGESLNLSPEQVVLREVFVLRSWSVSAHIVVENDSFFFKANCLGIYNGAPRVYRFLSEFCPGTTLELITHRSDTSSLWMFFHYVPGTNVEDLGQGQLLNDMALQVGEIQSAWAREGSPDPAGILDLRVERTAEMLQVLIERLEDQYLSQVGDRDTIPQNFIRRLEACLPYVQTRASEIIGLGWPNSILHTDLHPGNGLLAFDGKIRILDWDQAAIGFTCESVYWLEAFEGKSPWRANPAGESVKSAYLQSVPWGDPDQRHRAWALGESIGRVLSAYQSDRQNVSLERAEARGANIIHLLSGFLESAEGR